tara:strand:+ start:4388 stop:4702 length:315 start_codon:yes stop_codon:yes gene_type:complete
MTEFDKADADGSGSIDQAEWDRLALEDRRRVLDDQDAERDQKRKMAWFALLGMLLYPLGVVLAAFLGLNSAADIIGSMASIYFVSVAGIVSVFFGASAFAKDKN